MHTVTVGTAAPLHLPPPGDPLAGTYKEWLHLNVFDHPTGTVGLINASVHGDPHDPRAIAMGTALMHRPGRGWSWHTDIEPAAVASLGWASVGLPTLALAGLPDGQVVASVRSETVRARVDGSALLPAFDVPSRQPFGSGWICWTVLPRLALAGWLDLDGDRLDLAAASGYHDRNWGRFAWGDDAGWDWGAFVTPSPGPVIVLSRATDRAHGAGDWLVVAHTPAGRVRFRHGMVTVTRSGTYRGPLPRLPGAVAALHTGRRAPRLPEQIAVLADDRAGHWLDLRFTVEAAAQIVAAEPTRPGATFLHEMVGPFTARGVLVGEPFEQAGLGVVEHVD